MDLLPQKQNIQKSYIICSTGRSGSTLLGRSLAQLKCCGTPEEYFHYKRLQGLDLKDNPDKFLDYCNSVLEVGSTSNGVFGIKMHWWQMQAFLQLARQSSLFQNKQDLEILNYFFPNLKFIYIWRKDMAAQAVSTTIALQTDVWEKPSENTIIKSKEKELDDKNISLKFQPLKIYRWEQKFKDQNQRWRDFLTNNNLDYYEITNKKLIVSFQEEIRNIVAYLCVDNSLLPDVIEMATKSQSTQINKQFLRDYQRLPKFLLKIAAKVTR
ncbi:MAG: Stf0 family sulfotransferase [Oscillatoria sp. PMC 1068.18]|nr:Stf0 family sulfotransferase [Oscillatoria sp. PMC 1068.18]